MTAMKVLKQYKNLILLAKVTKKVIKIKTRSEMSMEKNRIRPVKSGKGIRMSYSRQKEVLGMPNLIEVQRDSYEWFLSTGLKEVLEDISPIEDYAQNLSLEFVDFKLCEDDEEVHNRGM
ncbi:MAG: hypothetical protein ACLUR5_17770 [Eubacterium ventriosum]